MKQPNGEHSSHVQKLLKEVDLGELKKKERVMAMQLLIEEAYVFCEETNDLGNVRNVK